MILTIIGLIIAAIVIACVLVFLVWYFFVRNAPFLSSPDDDITNWRPSTDCIGWYWRYNHTTSQYQYCHHDHMDPYYETDDTLTERCSNCGYVSTKLKDQ